MRSSSIRILSIVAVSAVAPALGCGATPTPGTVATTGSASPPPAPSAPEPPAQKLTTANVLDLMKPLSVAPSEHNLVKTASFDTGSRLPWMTSFSGGGTGSARVENGALCVEVKNSGTHPWDAQFRHREMTIQKGHKYSVRLKLGATDPLDLEVKLAMSGPPYRSYWSKVVNLTGAPQVVTAEFTMNANDDPTAEFAFHIGGKKAAKLAPYTVCVDDVVLEDPEFVRKPEPMPPPVPNVLVDQVGYLPGLAKIAIVKSDSTTPLAWQLLDHAGATVASGSTVVRGADAASGEKVHVVDFSSFAKVGTGYALRVGPPAPPKPPIEHRIAVHPSAKPEQPGPRFIADDANHVERETVAKTTNPTPAAGDVSHPFDIGPRVYKKLKYDALAFFYQQRSGVPIEMPYAGDAKWVRPAGHEEDKEVECMPESPCDYMLDVSGGWYDAGDHGKYVVNGGIATWTLLDLYERVKALGTAGDFDDGKMNIPENKNKIPDLLDEARFELDFLIKMQVPEGKPLAGMAHHKMHDREWTALATRPERDNITRYLHPPTTAATLNLAATAAQGARIWRTLDPAFATRCLTSAERAWKAAVEHPAVYASHADTMGGGAYEDDDVTDEFYWAAAELFATTKKDEYRSFLDKSPHRWEVSTNAGGQPRAMSWQSTSALGTISIALAGTALPKADVAAARAAVIKAADAFVANEKEQAFPVPFRSEAFPWGSNSDVLNDAVVVGLAYDFTKDKKYADAVENALGYVLGNNPNDQSYVTGYGFRPLQHPHHRFWAHQANVTFPEPPPGVLSGGPNSGLQDDYVQAAGLAGCAPMKCWIDNIEAFSANEVAINWNAPLAWVAAFLDGTSAGR
jgi:endoglucanase